MRSERAFSPAARAAEAPDPSRVLVIGCGALARELVAVIDQAGLANVDLTCLPATLHNRPGGIPAAVREKIRAARPRYGRIFIAYADCGTGGLLDAMLADQGVERLPGAHCYELYAGSRMFAAITDEDPATFFLTDFLARNFERLVIAGLGLDRHPELLSSYFGNYRRLVYLAQTDDPALVAAARLAARRLGLAFELRRTGYGDLTTAVQAVAAPAAPAARSRAFAFAPDATNVAITAHVERNEVDSLRQEQGLVPHGRPRVGRLRPMQRIASRPSNRRRYVHSMQRPTEGLHPVQQPAGVDPDVGSLARVTAPPARHSGTP
jgi:hypothetical protein